MWPSIARGGSTALLVASLGAGAPGCSCEEPRVLTDGGAVAPSPRSTETAPASGSSSSAVSEQAARRDGGTEDRDEIERLLLTMSDYRERFPGPPGDVELAIDCPDRRLLFVGFQHSSDPAEPRFVSLERRFRRYLDESKGRERTVLVEGRVRKPASSRERAIREAGGEGGLVSMLAREAGVETLASPEPEPDATARALRRRFSTEEICYAYFARSVALWHAQGARTPLDAFVADLPLPRASGCDFTEAAMAPIHERLLAERFAPANQELFRRLADPAHDETIVGRVLAAETRARDRHIVREIERRFVAGASLFAIYGTSHVVMQEPALRAVLCRRCEPGGCRVTTSTTPDGSVPSR